MNGVNERLAVNVVNEKDGRQYRGREAGCECREREDWLSISWTRRLAVGVVSEQAGCRIRER